MDQSSVTLFADRDAPLSPLSGPPYRAGDVQGALRDWELEGLGGIASNTKDWGKCPGTPTAPSDCCVGGTVR